MAAVLFLSLTSHLSARGQKAVEEQVELEYFSWGFTEDVWGGWLREELARYEGQYPNIKIKQESTTFTDKETVFTTRCEAGVGPDVADFNFDNTPQFAEKGYLMDLNPFIKKEGPDYIKNFYETALAPLTIRGSLYQMPAFFFAWLPTFNSELFREAGLDSKSPPKTTTEFLEYAKRLTRDTDGDGKIDQWGFGMTASRTAGLFNRYNGFLFSAGGDFLTPDNSASALNSPGALEGTKFYVELYTKHKVAHPGAVEMGPHDVRIAMANRKIAMMIGTAFTPGIVNSVNPNLKALEVLEMAAFPSFGTKRVYTSGHLGGMVMNSKTKHPKESWDLLKHMNSYDVRLRAYRANGWIPANIKAAQSEEIKSDKFGRVIVDNLGTAKFPPMIVEWPEIADIVTTALQSALSERQSVEEALLDAHRRINELLK
jgi:multiple sugar transport system substrate-binding protein